MKEFDFIDRYLKPICAVNALDDDTSLAIRGDNMVVNTDCIVEGRHFLPTDPPDTVAKKLIRVNVSDLASTGAKPRYLSLAMSLGDTARESWLATFASGLAEDLEEWGITLIGGDTTRTQGATALTASVIGDLEQRTPMRRWLAQPGDRVWLGRPLGLGGLGLRDAQAGRRTPMAWQYWVPQPQLELGLTMSTLYPRVACADVSDGLGADLGHIARASAVAITLFDVPVEPNGDINAGDDYCLVAVTDHDLNVHGMTQIGTVAAGLPAVWHQNQDISRSGYEHH